MPSCILRRNARGLRGPLGTILVLALLLAAVSPVSAALLRVTATTPADQAVGVPLASDITVSFAGLVKGSTVTADNVLVTSDLRGKLAGQVSWNPIARRLTFNPDTDFIAGEHVLVTVTRDVTDMGGVPLPVGHHFQFSTWTAPVPDGGFLTSPTGWSIGSIAFSLTVGDLSGDDLPEGIFVNTVPDSLTIWSPDGAGAFSSFAQLATHPLPRHSVLADVDEDGHADIVVATSSDTLDVFHGQGGGAFSRSSHAVPGGVTPYGAFAADLDADGDVDIATANFNGHDISVLMNDGAGGFSAAVQHAAGDSADSPRYLDGADFDGDGDIDVACCNGYSWDVSVFLNDGMGGFTVQEPLIPVDESPNFLHARDYDGDGRVDLVTINSIGETVSFLRGNGDGTFQPRVDHATGGPLPYGISSADLDGDGDLDLVIPIRGLDGWRPMWNDGAGGFTQGTLYPGGLHCHSIGVADFDTDGDLDVLAGYAISREMFLYEQVPAPVVVASDPSGNATGSATGNSVTLWFSTDLDPATVTSAAFRVTGSQSGTHVVTPVWDAAQKAVILTPSQPFFPGEIVQVSANGAGLLLSSDGLPHDGHLVQFMTGGQPAAAQFTGIQVPLPGSDPVAATVADLDGDLAGDLVVANFLSANLTLLLSGNGGMPAVAGTEAVGVGPVDVRAADLDGNGHLDLIAANSVSASVSVLLNAGGAVFAPAVPLGVSGTPFAVDGGDFDLDGDEDLVVAELGPDVLTVFWNDGAGAFPTSDALAVGGPPLDLAVADLDNDGDLDIVSVDSGNNRMEVFHYDSAAGFTSAGTFGTGSVPVSTFPWDTDGDGWLDLVSTDYASGGISVLKNLGDGSTFAPALSLPSGAQPHGLWNVDLDGDGRLDLVTANSGASDLTIFRNQGSGVFDGGTSVAAGTTPYAVVGGDWNGDGVIDLAAVNRSSGDLTFLLNGVSSTSAGPVPTALATGIGRIGPNPFRESVAVRFDLARAGRASVGVFDVRGRRVAGLAAGPLPAGSHRVFWDGRGDGGEPVAAGVYFVRLDAAGAVWTRKVLRLR
ncbi:MAG TPA: FG-GAP-like repeat-containing protein [bacterium]|nr:FG-GAP-like repeat-containing protein [bacterium]